MLSKLIRSSCDGVSVGLQADPHASDNNVVADLHLPSLNKIQESHWIIPATSAFTARAFSTASAALILNDRRNRLTGIMVQQMFELSLMLT